MFNKISMNNILNAMDLSRNLINAIFRLVKSSILMYYRDLSNHRVFIHNFIILSLIKRDHIDDIEEYIFRQHSRDFDITGFFMSNVFLRSRRIFIMKPNKEK